MAVDEVRVAVTTRGDQSNVFGNWRVRGTCPLTVDYLVKVIRVRDIRCFQTCSSNNLLLCQRCYASPGGGERAASRPQTGVPERPHNVVGAARGGSEKVAGGRLPQSRRIMRVPPRSKPHACSRA